MVIANEKGGEDAKIIPGVDEACFSEFFEPRLMERPIDKL